MIRRSILVLFLWQISVSAFAHPHHPGVFNAHDAMLVAVLLTAFLGCVLFIRKSLKKQGLTERQQRQKQERTQA